MPKLTDRLLVTLAVEDGRKDRLVFDTVSPGLGVRVTAKGTRTFIAQWTDLPSDLIANLRLASFGLVLVLVFLYRPQGLIPEARKLYRVDDR